jgi:Fe-S-cluster containining protein
MKLGNKFPWYSAGLHFECLQCGRCCAGPEGGYIWVSRPEIRLIADYLRIPVRELKLQFLRRVGFRMTIVEDPQTCDCVFLRRTGQGRGCAIYEIRPAQCRNWPFWESNLVSQGTWNSAANKCPGVNNGRLYSPEEIREKIKNKKWWRSVLRPVRRGVSGAESPLGVKDGSEKNKEVVARVSEIYNWIDQQQLANKSLAGQCSACGKCCDFESYGHRLYVTMPEIIYFVEKLGRANIKKMTDGRCCCQVDGECGVHAHRFSGCRIFCCKGDAEFQSEFTEAAIKKFKALCTELNLPYHYVELPVALKIAVTAENAG